MVVHTQSYALGHLVTSRFWHDIHENDLHFTFSDTGWAKSAWGKLYGPWLEGAAIFVLRYPGTVQRNRAPAADRTLWHLNVLLPAHDLPHADPCRSGQV